MLTLLKKFCHEDHHALSEPWSIEEYSYFCDGHILVRVPRIDGIPENDQAPDARKIIPANQPQEWFSVPDCKLPDYEPCKQCNGSGKDVECPECDGSGEVSLSNRYNEYECECKSCDASGVLSECPNCDGTGRIYPTEGILVGVAGFQPKYLLLLAALPNCKIGPTGPESLAWFVFDGGDGVLMPVNPERVTCKAA